MTNHTPTPWVLDEKSIHKTTVYSRRGDGYVIASVHDPERGSHCTATSIANAQLIATAPDLLDALEDAICLMYDQHPNQLSDAEHDKIASFKDIIAKAKGLE